MGTCRRLTAVSLFTALIITGCASAGKDFPPSENTGQHETAAQEQTKASSDGAVMPDQMAPASDEAAMPEESPSVAVISGGETYIPIKNFTFSQYAQTDSSGQEQTVNACGAWLRPQDVNGMPQVPWTEDMELAVTGQVLTFDCSLYDADYELLSEEAVQSQGSPSFPRQQEPYYVKLELSFQEGSASRTGYQYFFQVVSRGPTPILSVSAELNGDEFGTVKELPSLKGQGAFAALTQKDSLPYIPIGSRLFLSFPEGEAPLSARFSDFVLAESGEPAFSNRGESPAQELPSEDGSYSIYLGANLDAMYYGYSEAYQPGGVRRGFLIDCTFADGSAETYAIAVKTDAAFGIKKQPSSAYLMPKCGTGVHVFTEARPKKQASGLVLTFVMENDSSCDFSYGEEPKLYRFEGPDPKEMPLLPQVGWNDIAYTLKANRTKRLTIKLDPLYGPLDPGYYRFSKDLINLEDGTTETVYGDFVVN